MKKSAALLFIIIISLNIYPQDRWLKLNGPEGGLITALIARGDTVLAGTSYYPSIQKNGNIFYSTNSGFNWHKANHKNNSVADFALTNDGGIIAAASTYGVIKSFDLVNWFKIHNGGTNYNFSTVGVGEGENIYAGCRQYYFMISSNNGNDWYNIPDMSSDVDLLYYEGSTYLTRKEFIYKKIEPFGTWEIVFAFPSDNRFTLASDDQGNIFAPSWNYFHVSSDQGLSWDQRDTLFFLRNNSLENCVYNSRLIGACSDQTYSFGDVWGIIVSDDMGYTWKMSNAGLLSKLSGLRLAASGYDTYLGTNADGVYKSTDYGDSWSPINSGLTAADVWGIDFDPAGNLYAAAYGSGVSKSTDKGLSWTKLNDAFEQPYIYDVLAYDTNNIFVGTYEGLYKSTNGGLNFIRAAAVGADYILRFFRDNQNRMYLLDYPTGIYRSSDAGNSWIHLMNNLPYRVMSLAFDSSGNIYAGSRAGRIYKSTDDGASWIEKYYYWEPNASVNGICIAPNGTVFAAAYNRGILKSTDGGENWILSHGNVGYYGTWPVESDSKGQLYTTFRPEAIMTSTDNGESWEDITSNGVLLNINDIIFDENGLMYLATDESVWRSHSDSITQSTNIFEKVYEYSLSQNYPNPFNPSTTISFSLPKTEYVTLKIYNTLSEEIKTLINSQLDAGEHKINFDASNVSSGIYFYRITAGEYTSVKKMQYIK